MYPLENIIRTITRKSTDRLSFLLLHEGCFDYIRRLCVLPHNFYLIQTYQETPVWHEGETPPNLFVKMTLEQTLKTSIDFILTFNRLDSYKVGEQLSWSGHIPIINIDIAGSGIFTPLPFFAKAHVQNSQELFLRNGNLNVAINDTVKYSWLSNESPLTTVIPIPTEPYTVNPEATKILIDNNLPQQYLESLPITLSSDRFTADPTEGGFYLNLWQNETPKMLDCMASNIPVVTMQSPDLNNIAENRAAIFIQELELIENPSFIQDILNFPDSHTILSNAKKYVEENTYEKFKTSWNNLLAYAIHQFYTRG